MADVLFCSRFYETARKELANFKKTFKMLEKYLLKVDARFLPEFIDEILHKCVVEILSAKERVSVG